MPPLGLAIVELGEDDFAIRVDAIHVDEGVLPDPARPFGLSKSQISWAPQWPEHSFPNAPCASLSTSAFSRATTWGLGEHQAFLQHLGFQAFRRCFMVVRSWPCGTRRAPAGDATPHATSASPVKRPAKRSKRAGIARAMMQPLRAVPPRETGVRHRQTGRPALLRQGAPLRSNRAAT